MNGDPRPKRVLVVEDEATLRAVVSELLRGEGYIVDAAANGQDALQCMRRAPPDCMVLDLMMPIMDGRQLVKAMRADRLLAGIPFILVSAAFGLEEACRSLSALGCFSKPYDIHALVQTLRRVMA